jgi:hypothetical protein
MFSRIFKTKPKPEPQNSEYIPLALLPRLFLLDKDATTWDVTIETIVHDEIDAWFNLKKIPYRKVILTNFPYTIYTVTASRNKMKSLAELPGVVQIYDHPNLMAMMTPIEMKE